MTQVPEWWTEPYPEVASPTTATAYIDALGGALSRRRENGSWVLATGSQELLRAESESELDTFVLGFALAHLIVERHGLIGHGPPAGARAAAAAAPAAVPAAPPAAVSAPAAEPPALLVMPEEGGDVESSAAADRSPADDSPDYGDAPGGGFGTGGGGRRRGRSKRR
ncbi:MAG: hypothetical protein ACLGI2_01650 [Acidimicrobiia bacterium]